MKGVFIMPKFSKLKKAAASLMSAAMLGSALPAASIPTANAADHNYTEALAMSLYFFDANACGTGVTDGPLTWRGDCHTYDAQADLNNAQGLSAAEKEAVKAANGGSSIIDASGGYHDAGDHIKFSMTMGFSATCLGWSYFTNPDAYEKAGCTDHLLYILRNMCDYFMKITFLDDSGNVIAYIDQVASEGDDHGTWSSPEVQTMSRTVFWASPTTPIVDSAGQMASALASTSLAFKDIDPEYSEKCYKYARALSDFAVKYPTYKATGRGNMYNCTSQKDDVAWGQIWADLAEYKGKLPASYTPPIKLISPKQYSTGEWDGYQFTWDKVYSGYAALMCDLNIDKDTYVQELKTEIDGRKGLSTTSYNGEGWGASRYNCGLQMMAHKTGDAQLIAAAKFQMDHILGDNSRGYSFLDGYGTKWPTHIHHRAANPGNGNQTSADNPECKYTLYGALIGGDDASGNYEDHADRYQFTEPALDYNGCFALAIAPLVTLYGGDASAMESIEKSAPEINENFVFGSYQQQPPTDPPADILYGDANCDNTVDISDAVLIMQYQANPDKYTISEKGLANADCVDNPKGVTATDALGIQMVEAKTISAEDLPITSEEINNKIK